MRTSRIFGWVIIFAVIFLVSCQTQDSSRPQNDVTITETRMRSTSTFAPSQTPNLTNMATSLPTETNTATLAPPTATKTVKPTTTPKPTKPTATASNTPLPSPTEPTATATSTSLPSTPSEASIFRLVFANRGNVFLINSDGTAAVQVTSDGNYFSPVISPQGDRIAFVGTNSKGKFGVFSVKIDGSDLKKHVEIKTDPEIERFYPIRWSPDGQYILYSTRRAGSIYETQIVRIKNNKITKFEGVNNAQWSPDSLSIVHWLDRGNDEETIAVSTIDGRERRNLTQPEKSGASYPTWSSDGKRVAYVDADQLITIKPDGTQKIEFTQANYVGGPLAYSPNGEWIAYGIRSGPGTRAIGIIRVDDSDQQIATKGGLFTEVIYAMSWSPDGTQIAYIGIEWAFGFPSPDPENEMTYHLIVVNLLTDELIFISQFMEYPLIPSWMPEPVK